MGATEELIDGLVIDAGHGGKDTGAICSDFYEKDMVLKISLYQYKRFKELGVPVKITRMSDIGLDSTARTDLVKKAGMKVCISNHINAGGGDGAETIHSIHSNGQLAHAILNELVREGQNKRRVFTRSSPTDKTKDYYFMHRMTGSVQTIIVEYGFLDSKGDDLKQIINDWEKYAEAVVRSVTTYLGYDYNKPAAPKPAAKPAPKPAAKPVTKPVYRIIAGAFTEKTGADKHLAAVKKHYPDAYIQTVK